MSKLEKRPPTRRPARPASGAFAKPLLCSPGFLSLILGLLTLVVYLPSAWNGFVDYDDEDYITGNSWVQRGLTWETLRWAFTTGHASNWHPLTWVSHALDCQLFGQQAGAHHLVSVGFHLANTLLVFRLLRQMSGALWRSAMVAALFALHPLHVESVAWVSERKDVLSALFFLLSLGAYGRYVRACELPAGVPAEVGGSLESSTPVRGREVRARRPEGRGSQVGAGVLCRPWLPYCLALWFFGLGLMCKPMLVTLPFVLLLLDFWPLQRLRFSSPLVASVGWRLMLEKLPFLALSVVSSVVTFLVQRRGGAVSTVLPLGSRVANALVSYARYVGKTFWPEHLSVLYPHPGHWPPWAVIAATAALAAVFLAVVMLARSRPYLTMGWLWFCGMLVPVIGVVQVGIQSMADRYMYLPAIGLFIGAAWGVADLALALRWRTPALAAGATLALTACAGLTAHQLRYWHNSETLFGRAVQATRRNYLAYNNLGFYLSHQGRMSEAMENYKLSLGINPAYEDALNNMGHALASQKRYAEAIGFYEAALRVRPNHPEVHNNLGNALSETGKVEEAIRHYLITLREQPDHADAHNNLGIALAMQGKLEEAITHFRTAIRLKPADASAHSNLGNALAVQHKFPEAIQQYQEAFRLKPADAQAHNNLANALAGLGRLDEAIGHYQQALLLNADNPEAHSNLAAALAAQGQVAEAVSHYEASLRLNPANAEAHCGLASVLVRQGRRDEAISHLAEALRIRPDMDEAKRQLSLLK